MPDNVKNLVILDDVGAMTGVLRHGDTTDDSRPTFSGEAEPNGKVIIYGNDKTLGEAKVGADGKWVFTPPQDLKDGEYDFFTEVLDQAGNRSGKSSPTHITLDTSDVDIKITRVVDTAGSITGDIAPLGVTDDTRPQIHGTAKPGSTVTVCDVNEGDDYRVVVVLGTTTVQPDGRWTFIPSEDLQEGAHALSAVATDLAGNTSTSANFSFTVDTTAPDKPTIDEVDDDVGAIQGLVANGGTTDDSTPTLWGRAEANAKVIIYDNGGVLGSVMADPGGTWIFTPTSGLSEGRHALTATATDAAGNTSLASDVYVITTDYTSPDAPVIVSVFDAVGDLTGNLNPGDSTDDARPRISGTAETNSTVEIYDGSLKIGSTVADASGHWSFTPTANLSQGEHSISAQATDVAGNVSPLSSAFGLTVTSLGTSGVEEFDVFNSGGMNWNFPSRFGMLVNSGSASQTKLSGTADVGDLGSTSACISLQGNPAKIQFFIPGDGATAFSLAMGRLGSGPSDHSGGTVTLKAFDAQGVLLDTVVSPSYTDYYHWYTLALKAPANKLIYTIELVSNDPGGILFDHAAWGSAVVTASSALETHTVVESVVAEHADTGALTQALSEPAPAADSRTASNTHEASISPLTDTFYGVPAGEGEVVTLQYSADSYFASASNQGIHGGSGVDTLKLVGGDQTLDLTLPTSQGKLTGIEIIDITGSAGVAGQVSGANTLTLSLKDVLENGRADLFHATDTHAVQMMVKGDGNDIVNLRDGEPSEGRASNWSEQGRVIVEGMSYVVYEPLGRDAELLVQQGVTVNLA